MTDDELAAIKSHEEGGMVERTKEALDLRTFGKPPKRDAFRSRLLAQAFEAVRRGAINAAQFRESAAIVGVSAEEQQLLLDAVGS
jgi:hypothetical protein